MGNPRKMVEEIVGKYSLNCPSVFSAMFKVPREKFIPPQYRNLAYEDGPVSIGEGQTISQPYTVAFMTDLLDLDDKESVLEIGTGSGYQAAVLSLLAKKVFSIERIKPLALEAKKRLKKLGYSNVEVKAGQGEKGWEEKAPFDAIIITAGIEKVPKSLFKQLKNNGVLVAPVGRGMDKVMTRFRRGSSGQVKFKKEKFGIFHFVPFVESN